MNVRTLPHRYATLDMQRNVLNVLKPLLREGKEAISRTLHKGAVGGHAVFILRRGIVAARGATIPELYEVTREGAMIGEHALMSADRPCVCDYQARTRSELYALAIDDLNVIVSGMMADGHDVSEMASVVHADYWQKRLRRALRMRIVVLDKLPFESAEEGSAGGIDGSAQTDAGNDILRRAATRLQANAAVWGARRRDGAVLTAEMMQDVVPGLFKRRHKDWKRSSSPPMASPSNSQSTTGALPVAASSPLLLMPTLRESTVSGASMSESRPAEAAADRTAAEVQPQWALGLAAKLEAMRSEVKELAEAQRGLGRRLESEVLSTVREAMAIASAPPSLVAGRSSDSRGSSLFRRISSTKAKSKTTPRVASPASSVESTPRE
jgi:hypothetical protein